MTKQWLLGHEFSECKFGKYFEKYLILAWVQAWQVGQNLVLAHMALLGEFDAILASLVNLASMARVE
jgi:hypothetical protein